MISMEGTTQNTIHCDIDYNLCKLNALSIALRAAKKNRVTRGHEMATTYNYRRVAICRVTDGA